MSLRTMSIRQYILLIFMVGLLTRLLVFAYIAHEPMKFYTYDSDGYDRRAQNLLRYGMLASEAQPPLTPDLDRTPVYPAVLAAAFAVFGHVPAAAILLQIVLGSLTGVFAFLLAREFQFTPVVGLIAGLIVAVDPVSLMTANRLLTETLFTMLLVAGTWTVVRFWNTPGLAWLLLASILFALTALTRPISQVLPFALVPLFLLASRHGQLRRPLLYGLMFVVLSTALTYSWAYRNYRMTGVFTLSTISDTNLIYYRARAVLAEVEGLSQDEAWSRLEQRIDQTAQQQGMTTEEKVQLQRTEAIAIFRAYPVETAKMFVKGVGRLLVDPGYTISCTLLDRTTTAFDCFPGKSSMNEPGLLGKAIGKIGTMTVVQQFALLWSTLLLAFVYTTALVGIGQLVRQRRWLLLTLLLIMIGYFVLLAAGAEANSRFRIPTMPFFALLSGVGASVLGRWHATRGQRTIAFAPSLKSQQ